MSNRIFVGNPQPDGSGDYKYLDYPSMVELFAQRAHESWSGWLAWMVEKWDQTYASGETFQARWARQAATPYAELSEAEKESDRVEAREYLKLLGIIGK